MEILKITFREQGNMDPLPHSLGGPHQREAIFTNISAITLLLYTVLFLVLAINIMHHFQLFVAPKRALLLSEIHSCKTKASKIGVSSLRYQKRPCNVYIRRQPRMRSILSKRADSVSIYY